MQSEFDFQDIVDKKNERVKVSIPGRFSVYNALASISVARLFGANTQNIKEALDDIKVLGRSELVENKLDLKIMIDYAHTPDSLENILKTTLLPLYPNGKVDAGEVGLPITRDDLVLPCGIYGRYISND